MLEKDKGKNDKALKDIENFMNKWKSQKLSLLLISIIEKKWS